MKKISFRYNLWLLRNNKNKWSKDGGRNKFVKIFSRRKVDADVERIILPKIVSVHDDLNALIGAVNSIRESVTYARFRPIDFRNIETIHPGGALILASEIDRLRIKRGMKLVPWLEDEWAPVVRKTFHQFGLFSLLNINKKDRHYAGAGNIKYVPLMCGRRARGELALLLRKKLNGIIQGGLETKPWYIALTEAMTNVAQHAYKENSGDISLYQMWWLSGAYEKLSKKLTVMFYDQGLTIPGTLPFSKKWDKLKDFIVEGATDSDKIQAAFEIGNSQTHQPYRGKGLIQLLGPIKSRPNGSILVVSRYGIYRYDKVNDQITEEKRNNDVPLMGTFIEWTIDIGEK